MPTIERAARPRPRAQPPAARVVSGQRARRAPRCPGCSLHASVCICGALPRIVNRTRVVLLAHARELVKPTNTGRLVARTLAACEVRVTGARRLPDAPWQAAPGQALLFPAPEAIPIADWRASVSPETPLTIVVPDGTWAQASHLRRRLPGLSALPSVSVPAGPPSAFRLRRPPRPGALCTLEAVARALEVLEGSSIRSELERALALFVEATLAMRRGVTTPLPVRPS